MIQSKGEISNGEKTWKIAESLSLNMPEGLRSSGQVESLIISRNVLLLENRKASG